MVECLGQSQAQVTYAYDNASKLTGITQSSATVGFIYDANNRLTNWGGTAFTYNDNGNLTSDGTRTYTWDVRNRLASVSGGASGSFTYDATERGQSKTVSGTTTKFLYDGLNVIQELDGSLTPAANLLVGLGFDETFIRTDSAARYLLPDALGSTLALTDGSAATRTSYTYEPYGKTTATGDPSTNAFQYTGRENDNTGLYYYRARYYQPEIERFVSEDPIGLAGGLNAYGYVGGNPIGLIDPLGLQSNSGGNSNSSASANSCQATPQPNLALVQCKLTDTMSSPGSPIVGCTYICFGHALPIFIISRTGACPSNPLGSNAL